MDINGNPIRQGSTRYYYDALNRLIRIEMPDQIQELAYDCLHRCLAKTVITADNRIVRRFLYDGMHEIGSFDEHQLLDLRILGDAPHAELGAAIAIEINGQVFDPRHDLPGSVSALIPLDGSDLEYYFYSAFGQQEGGHLCPWRFASKRIDDASGLIAFGRRFYLPELGRFLTPDPAGFADGRNLYAYVHNDPLSCIDPFGLTALGMDFRPYPYYPFHTSLYSMKNYHWDAPNSRILPSINPQRSMAPCYYVNGMQNSINDVMSGARQLLNTFHGQANIIPAYSQTFGFFGDLTSVRSSTHRTNYNSDFIRQFRSQLKTDMTRMDHEQDPRKIFIVSFSRGSADVYHTVKDFTPEEKQRLFITACGPIMILNKNLGFRVINLISEGDWCSKMCTGIHCEKDLKKYQNPAEVHLLDQIDGFSGFNKDHFFESRTYQGGISDFCIKEYQKYGILK